MTPTLPQHYPNIAPTLQSLPVILSLSEHELLCSAIGGGNTFPARTVSARTVDPDSGLPSNIEYPTSHINHTAPSQNFSPSTNFPCRPHPAQKLVKMASWTPIEVETQRGNQRCRNRAVEPETSPGW